MFQPRIINRLVFAVLVGLLAACGGGSDAVISESDKKVLSEEFVYGVFIDSPVENLAYRAVSASGDIRGGRTDEQGRFEIQDGDEITFFIGELTLNKSSSLHGSIEGIVFPYPITVDFEIAEGADLDIPFYQFSPLDMSLLSSSEAFNDQVVKNIAVLLQSLDIDAAPHLHMNYVHPERDKDDELENRNKPQITLSDDAHVLAANLDSPVDLRTVHLESRLLNLMLSAGPEEQHLEENKKLPKTFVSETAAIAHLRESLAADEEERGPQKEDVDLSFNEALEACLDRSYQDSTYVRAITRLDCQDGGLTSLEGIEQLFALQELDLDSNRLTSVTIGPELALTRLEIGNNELSYLDVSSQLSLETLFADRNALATLHLPDSLNLKTLLLNSNQLSGIDVSSLHGLQFLAASQNQLSSVSLAINGDLEELYVQGNQLEQINVEWLRNLHTLDAQNNKLSSIELGDTPALQSLFLSRNDLPEDLMDQLRELGLEDLRL